MKIAEFLRWAETRWPAESAEEWDNPGLIAGDLDAEVSSILLCIDITAEVLKEAKSKGCSLVLAHHPLLLGGIDSLREDGFKGALIAEAIRSNIGLFSAHTNADIVEDGVSDSLAKKLGLKNIRALDGSNVGHGRVGHFENETLGSLIERLLTILPKTEKGISYVGELDMPLHTVALVAGSGMSFVGEVEADVFITSDIKHHPAIDFKEQARITKKQALVEISHYAAESVWLEPLATQLSELAVRVEISEINTDPWDGVVR